MGYGAENRTYEKGKKDGISVPGERKDEEFMEIATSRINRNPQEIMMGSSFPSSPNMEGC